jgi:AraC-like DNA-binding protein
MLGDRLVARAISYITKNLHQKIRIEDICRAVGTNASTLNFKFHRELDLSVGQYIIAERMKAARHLLVSTTYSLSEIALRCGFENVYYFSNAFKKSNRISPLAYRKQRHPLQ